VDADEGCNHQGLRYIPLIQRVQIRGLGMG